MCANVYNILDASLQVVPWKALIQNAYMNRVNLSAQGFFATPDLSMNWETGKVWNMQQHLYI